MKNLPMPEEYMALNQEDYLKLLRELIPSQHFVMRKVEFFERLFEIIPEQARVVSSTQAADIWNLRALYEYNVQGHYNNNSLRIRSGKNAKSLLHKLSQDEQLKVLGITSNRAYFYLVDILTIPLRPWRAKGGSKPDYLRTHRTTKRRKKNKKAVAKPVQAVTAQVS